MIIAFDIDGTILTTRDTPKYEVLDLVRWFLRNKQDGDDVVFWSGGGLDYAEHWRNKLGFEHVVKIREKGSFIPDISVDDEDAKLGKVNIWI